MKKIMIIVLLFVFFPNITSAKVLYYYVPGICSDKTSSISSASIINKVIFKNKNKISLLENNTLVSSIKNWEKWCTVFDIASSVGQKAGLHSKQLSKYPTPSESELREMVKEVSMSLRSNKGVILFCHSQGTIFCHHISERISKRTNKNNLKIIQIAPASHHKNTIGSIGHVKFKDDILGLIGLNPNLNSSYVDSKIEAHSLKYYFQDKRSLERIKWMHKMAVLQIEFPNSKINTTFPIRTYDDPNILEARDLELLLTKNELHRVPNINFNLESVMVSDIRHPVLNLIKNLKQDGYIWSNVTLAGKWILYKPFKKEKCEQRERASQGTLGIMISTKNRTVSNLKFYGFSLHSDRTLQTNIGIEKHRQIFWNYLCKYELSNRQNIKKTFVKDNLFINKDLSTPNTVAKTEIFYSEKVNKKCSDFVEIPFKYIDRYKDNAWKMLRDENGDYWYAKIPSIDQCDNYGTFIDGIIYKYNKSRECLDTSIISTLEKPNLILSLCAETYKNN